MKVEDRVQSAKPDDVYDLAREIIRNNIEKGRSSSVSDPGLIQSLQEIEQIMTNLDRDREIEDVSSRVLVCGSKCLSTHSGAITLEFLELLQRMVEAASWLNPGAVREYSDMVHDAAVKLLNAADLLPEQRLRVSEILQAAKSELSGTDVNCYFRYED